MLKHKYLHHGILLTPFCFFRRVSQSQKIPNLNGEKTHKIYFLCCREEMQLENDRAYRFREGTQTEAGNNKTGG